MTIEIPAFVCGIAAGVFGTCLTGGAIWIIKFVWRKHKENERFINRIRSMGIK